MRPKPEQLELLAATMKNCRSCPLAEKRHHIVFGEGNPDADIMLVGEGPGKDEDEKGSPFIGKAGRLLTKILSSAGLQRSEVYITNVVKCRPPGNRNPRRDEIRSCERYLLSQIEIVSPLIIVALGNIAKQFFLGEDTPGITRVRGRFFPWPGSPIEIFPMYHPSYLLRNDARHRGSPKWQTWQDVKSLAGRLTELRGGRK